ncbi:serine/threonine protein kinase [Oscillatoria nigro-viridis PCC 7112]|uniref:Serine/threonine protein kinase n=1 Tax=Phormidium nigroviride PCC 7112 TaxID=179408 RepID=K9VQE4_9CYAN|nr:serine/threonine-protein kinase [Oscillatoria nigro-viridis]AFZ10151.1 serine/threonine protein kinase [Oscillatoria nigro-viridis PCC 7112]
MLAPGKILQERYQLQQRLGRTAAGHQTWLAVDLASQEQVTLKMLAFSPEMQWEELKLFEREAQVLQALNHPRIPCYRDYFSLEREAGAGLPWFGLVQDYIPGCSLQELLEKGKQFSEKNVQKIATEVLEILIYLHGLSPPVLHRDIKPSNLIWGKDKHVYLVDFGAVQAQAAVTGVTFTVVGTSGYAPLEQFWGRAVPGSDLYALGATLIHLLTGATPADLPQKDSRIQFSDRVSVSPSLVSWIEKMTEIALEKRFSEAREALAALKSGNIQGANLQIETVRKIAKPRHSRIQVSKSATELNIKIPSDLVRAPFSVGFMGILIILLFVPIILVFWQLNFSIGLGLFTIIASSLVHFLGQGNKITFNRNYFKLEHQIFGWTYSQQTGKISEILGTFIYSMSEGNQIRIRSGNDRGNYFYILAKKLKEVEAAWLAQEIQDWLNLR